VKSTTGGEIIARMLANERKEEDCSL